MKFNLDKLRILYTTSLMILLCGWLQAQTTVSGVVSNTDAEALIGASILVEGTSDGGVSDIDGSFSIKTMTKAPFNIIVSYTGHESQTIAISGSQSGLAISLEETATLLNDVVISASRKREKVQEAPASISVIGARKLEASPQVNPVRNLISTPGVQIQQQSAGRINISMRGAAGLFGTGVFPIMDYRSLVGPGIGTFDVLNSPINNIDLARIEVVRGPGSALYGPGVTQGVVHFITKNPIDYPGTTFEVVAGELSTFGVSVRHAERNESKTFGYKINASYKRGNEFTLDVEEDATQIARFRNTIVSPVITDGIVDATKPGRELLSQSDLDPDGDGNMMQDFYNSSQLNATLEFRPSDDLNITTNFGFNNASAVFYNSQGEGLSQANEYFAQARIQKGGLFAQAFYVENTGGSDKKPTFLYQTGNSAPIARKQLEAQAQYNFGLKNVLDSDWTIGVDYRQSTSETKNLVYGRNEQDDDYSIIGGYVQGKFRLDKKLDLVLAARYDQFNFADEGQFAPRAALVYKMNPKHTFRASYNRASAPNTALQINIDFPLSTVIPGAYDIWLVGNKEEQIFGNDPQIVFPANFGFPSVPVGTPGFPLAFAHGAVNGLVVPGLLDAFVGTPFEPFIPILEPILLDPSNVPGGVSGSFVGLNLFNQTPLGLVNAPQSKIRTDDTYEIGYKGLLGDKLSLSVDVYRTTQKNFTLFTAISPSYLLAGANFGNDLGTAMQSLLTPQVQNQFDLLVQAMLLTQAEADLATGIISQGIFDAYSDGGAAFQAQIAPFLPGGAFPFIGTTPTEQVPDNGVTHIAAGYRTFDEITYYGSDVGLEYYFTDDLSAFINYSWISDSEFEVNVVGAEGLAPLPYFLNIPEQKYRVGLNYTPEKGFRANVSFQHDDSFNADFGQFSGPTDEKNLFDVGFGYKFDGGLAIDLTATNVFDNEYRAFANMPKIGRRAIGRLVYTFGADK